MDHNDQSTYRKVFSQHPPSIAQNQTDSSMKKLSYFSKLSRREPPPQPIETKYVLETNHTHTYEEMNTELIFPRDGDAAVLDFGDKQRPSALLLPQKLPPVISQSPNSSITLQHPYSAVSDSVGSFSSLSQHHLHFYRKSMSAEWRTGVESLSGTYPNHSAIMPYASSSSSSSSVYNTPIRHPQKPIMTRNLPDFVEELNIQQRKAVLAPLMPVAILAPAGSGKTKTLVARIAYCINQGISPSEVLAVTFTKKAVSEVKERLTQLLGLRNSALVRVSNFHQLGLRIISKYFKDAGFDQKFTLIAGRTNRYFLQECVIEWVREKEAAEIKSRAVSSGVSVELSKSATYEDRDSRDMDTDTDTSYSSAEDGSVEYSDHEDAELDASLSFESASLQEQEDLIDFIGDQRKASLNEPALEFFDRFAFKQSWDSQSKIKPEKRTVYGAPPGLVADFTRFSTTKDIKQVFSSAQSEISLYKANKFYGKKKPQSKQGKEGKFPTTTTATTATGFYHVQYGESLSHDDDEEDEDETLQPEYQNLSPSSREIYHMYQNKMKRCHFIDFGDIVPLAVRLLQRNPSILQQVHNASRYIFVDEFQDVSNDQWELIRLMSVGPRALSPFYSPSAMYEQFKSKSLNELSVPPPCLTVVGDDDQSIYGFRGASGLAFNAFFYEFSGSRNHQAIVLLQTYRSTPEIVAAGRAVISYNPRRFPKDVFTAHQPGHPVTLISKSTRELEHYAVIREMLDLREKHRYAWSDFAVLSRTQNEIKRFVETFRKLQIGDFARLSMPSSIELSDDEKDDEKEEKEDEETKKKKENHNGVDASEIGTGDGDTIDDTVDTSKTGKIPRKTSTFDLQTESNRVPSLNLESVMMIERNETLASTHGESHDDLRTELSENAATLNVSSENEEILQSPSQSIQSNETILALRHSFEEFEKHLNTLQTNKLCGDLRCLLRLIFQIRSDSIANDPMTMTTTTTDVLSYQNAQVFSRTIENGIFKHIVNHPRKGLGQTFFSRADAIASTRGISVMDASLLATQGSLRIPGATRVQLKVLGTFFDALKACQDHFHAMDLLQSHVHSGIMSRAALDRSFRVSWNHFRGIVFAVDPRVKNLLRPPVKGVSQFPCLRNILRCVDVYFQFFEIWNQQGSPIDPIPSRITLAPSNSGENASGLTKTSTKKLGLEPKTNGTSVETGRATGKSRNVPNLNTINTPSSVEAKPTRMVTHSKGLEADKALAALIYFAQEFDNRHRESLLRFYKTHLYQKNGSLNTALKIPTSEQVYCTFELFLELLTLAPSTSTDIQNAFVVMKELDTTHHSLLDPSAGRTVALISPVVSESSVSHISTVTSSFFTHNHNHNHNHNAFSSPSKQRSSQYMNINSPNSMMTSPHYVPSTHHFTGKLDSFRSDQDHSGRNTDPEPVSFSELLQFLGRSITDSLSSRESTELEDKTSTYLDNSRTHLGETETGLHLGLGEYHLTDIDTLSLLLRKTHTGKLYSAFLDSHFVLHNSSTSTSTSTIPGQRERDSLTVTTIHQSKGLEWPVVFVIGCNEGHLPVVPPARYQVGPSKHQPNATLWAHSEDFSQLYLLRRGIVERIIHKTRHEGGVLATPTSVQLQPLSSESTMKKQRVSLDSSVDANGDVLTMKMNKNKQFASNTAPPRLSYHMASAPASTLNQPVPMRIRTECGFDITDYSVDETFSPLPVADLARMLQSEMKSWKASNVDEKIKNHDSFREKAETDSMVDVSMDMNVDVDVSTSTSTSTSGSSRSTTALSVPTTTTTTHVSGIGTISKKLVFVKRKYPKVRYFFPPTHLPGGHFEHDTALWTDSDSGSSDSSGDYSDNDLDLDSAPGPGSTPGPGSIRNTNTDCDSNFHASSKEKRGSLDTETEIVGNMTSKTSVLKHNPTEKDPLLSFNPQHPSRLPSGFSPLVAPKSLGKLVGQTFDFDNPPQSPPPRKSATTTGLTLFDIQTPRRERDGGSTASAFSASCVDVLDDPIVSCPASNSFSPLNTSFSSTETGSEAGDSRISNFDSLERHVRKYSMNVKSRRKRKRSMAEKRSRKFSTSDLADLYSPDSPNSPPCSGCNSFMCPLYRQDPHHYPPQAALTEDQRKLETHIETERRLAYVAITRARTRVYLSFNEEPEPNGDGYNSNQPSHSVPSRFLHEIAPHIIAKNLTGKLLVQGKTKRDLKAEKSQKELENSFLRSSTQNPGLSSPKFSGKGSEIPKRCLYSHRMNMSVNARLKQKETIGIASTPIPTSVMTEPTVPSSTFPTFQENQS